MLINNACDEYYDDIMRYSFVFTRLQNQQVVSFRHNCSVVETNSAEIIPDRTYSMDNSQIQPIVPITPHTFDIDKNASVLLRLKQNYGLRRFLLVAPELGVRLTGFPDRKVYREFGEFLLGVKNSLADTDIQVGWWCAPSFQSGRSKFQNITGLDGKTSDISSCPLDERFREVFPGNIALVAGIANPFVIQFEDDYQFSNHSPVRFGCFCPLHLKEFALKFGKEYTREELSDIFSCVTPESVRLRRQWGELSRDTLAGFAGLVREKIDEVSPDTRVSLCQSGMAGFDGDFTEAVAAAFAGNTKPLVRVYGSTYCSDNAWEIPYAIFNVLYSKANLPKHFELMHESDTYPHTRFFMSAAKIKSLMAAAFSYGMDNSLFYTTQYLSDPLEESGYSEMFKAESKRFSTIRNEVRDCTPAGVEICHSPWSHVVVPYDPSTAYSPSDSLSPWLGILGKYGIPYSVKPEKVKFLAGNYASFISDDEVKDLLSHGVMMDGQAAHILSRRGFGDLIGTEVVPGTKATFCTEIIEEDSGFVGITGKDMYNFIFAPAGSEGGGFYELTPNPQAKTLTSFCDPSGKAVIPGMIRYENSLGGRVVITAFNLQDNMSSTVFNYRKKEIIRQSIEWLGKESLPVYVEHSPNVYCIYNQSQTGNKAIVTLINLCSDTAPRVELSVSSEWIGCRVSVLNSEGEWDQLKISTDDRKISILVELRLMEPMYLKLTRYTK